MNNNSNSNKIKLVLNIWDYDIDQAYIWEGEKPNFEDLEKELKETKKGSKTLIKFGFVKGEWCDPDNTEKKKNGFSYYFGNRWTGKQIFETL